MKRTHGVLAAVAVTATLMAAFGGASGAVADAVPSSSSSSSSSATKVATSENGRYIVRFHDPKDAARSSAVLKGTGVRVLADLSGVGMTVISGPADALARAAALPAVLAITPDVAVKAQSLGFAPSSQPGAMTNVTRVTGAQAAWKAGYTGAGVDVAVLDTGVAPVPSLKDSSKVVVGPDLSFESQASNLRYLDTFGHGTAMSSIIAGREIAKTTGAKYAADTTNFIGMAPDARIVSVKLGDRSGTVDVSQLIAGIDWVVQNRSSNGLNIKVLNLSFGLNSKNPYTTDPLSFAAENAWLKGIFVVASAGNDGQQLLGMASPAYDPWLVAVGASDTLGTDTMADDTVADFSQHPNSLTINRAPDIVAPGSKIVSAGVPGSAIYDAFPAARVGNGLIRGSGTSQAAAVVSGAVALLRQKYPTASPDLIKELLRRTATPLSGASLSLQGKGELNVGKAITTSLLSVVVSQAQASLEGSVVIARPGSGSAPLELARGDSHVTIDGSQLLGEKDIMGQLWLSLSMATATTKGTVWSSDGSFNGNQWIGGSFATDTTSVAGKTWGGRTWSGRTWSGRTWSGRTWSGSTWNGSTWTSASWDSPVTGATWASDAWSSASWK